MCGDKVCVCGRFFAGFQRNYLLRMQRMSEQAYRLFLRKHFESLTLFAVSFKAHMGHFPAPIKSGIFSYSVSGDAAVCIFS